MDFMPETHAGTWLNAAAVISLVGGIITGLAFGNQTFGGDFFSFASTWIGWAFFSCGFAGFVLFAALGWIAECLTSIRYMLSLATHGAPANTNESAAMQPRDIRDLAAGVHATNTARQDR